MTGIRTIGALLALACGVAFAAPAPRAQADDGEGGPDLGFATQAWFHLGINGTADYRVDGEPTAEGESIDNSLGFGVLGELRIAQFFGVGATFQWLRKQHDDDNSADRWTVWDLDLHVRLRVPLFFLNLYLRVPFGLSQINLPDDALVGRTVGDVTITGLSEGTGWNAATLFGIELSLIPLLGLYFEIGPTWRHLPFEIETSAGTFDFEVRTRELTMNFGATLAF